MKNRYDIDEFYNELLLNITKSEENKYYPALFYKSIYSGKNSFYQKETVETKKFDPLWINTIESYYPSINKITLNLKSALRYESEIIPIEKAKKVGIESVKHLMSHSNFIREQTENNIVPKQILSILSETEYGIYENRFIMTLIRRLRGFINRRIKLMKQQLEANHITNMYLNSTFGFENSKMEITVDLKKNETVNQNKNDEENLNILARAEKMHKLITRLNNSKFMKLMARFKEVSPPIMKTQIILRNPDFKNAYLLWLYLDRANDLEYEYNVKNINKRFTESYTKRVNKSLMLLCTTMLANTKPKGDCKVPEEKITYKQKAAKTIYRLPLEIDVEPVEFQVEDTGLNEYFLEKNKQLLNKQFKELIDEGNSYKVALKKALWQTISITNGLYQSFFEYSNEDDIFQKLLIEEEESAEQLYKNAYDKYILACSVREVKEADFKQTISLENKWQKELKKLHTARLLEVEKQEEKKINDLLDEIEKKYKEKLDVVSERNLQKKREIIKQNRINQALKLKREYNEFIEKRRSSKAKWEKYLAVEKKRLSEQFKTNKEKEEERFKQSILNLKDKHSEKMLRLGARYKDKHIEYEQKIKKNITEKIAKIKERDKTLSVKQKNKQKDLLEQKGQELREIEAEKAKILEQLIKS